MSPYQFLSQLRRVKAGDGFLRSVKLNPIADVRTSACLSLDNSNTVPRLLGVENNLMIVVVPAGQTSAGRLHFVVPNDYDATADKLRIRILGNSSGNVDAPTVSATVHRKREKTAEQTLSAPPATSAFPKSGAPAAIAEWRELSLDGRGCKPGDMLQVTLTTSAHATDALHIYALEIQYSSCLVAYDETARA
jgi:hypothetical protein